MFGERRAKAEAVSLSGGALDVVVLPSGASLTLRFAKPDDAEGLQHYFRSLSVHSRTDRFLGALSELSPRELGRFVDAGEDGRFSVLAVTTEDGFETIVGEARYAFAADMGDVELGLSVDDRWQGRGIGSALLHHVQCRAAALGVERLFGDTLRSNAGMMGLARKSGFAFAPSPGDWKLVRFEKYLGVSSPLQQTSRASRRLAAGALAATPGVPRACEEIIPAASAA